MHPTMARHSRCVSHGLPIAIPVVEDLVRTFSRRSASARRPAGVLAGRGRPAGWSRRRGGARLGPRGLGRPWFWAPWPLALALLGPVTFSGCASSGSCVREGCRAPAVCGLDGTCAPLDQGPELRFARLVSLEPVDWAVSHRRRSTRGPVAEDVLELGGPRAARIHLEFEGLPAGAEIVRAVLILPAQPPSPGPSKPSTAILYRTTALGEGSVRHAPLPPGPRTPPVRRRVRPGHRGPLLFDATSLVRDARRSGQDRVATTIVLEPSHRVPWRLASPRAGPEAGRPRLELWVR
jgi:hypothetical protein